jgi:hypothetical protein
MTADAPRPSIYDAYGEGGFAWAQISLNEAGFLSDEELATVLEKNPGQPLPAWLREYLVRRLRRQVRKKTGPKPGPGAELKRHELLLARLLYRKALPIFQYLVARRRRAAGKAGVTLPRAELAAHEMTLDWLQVNKGLFSDLDPRSLHNLISKDAPSARSSSSTR